MIRYADHVCRPRHKHVGIQFVDHKYRRSIARSEYTVGIAVGAQLYERSQLVSSPIIRPSTHYYRILLDILSAHAYISH